MTRMLQLLSIILGLTSLAPNTARSANQQGRKRSALTHHLIPDLLR
jgi:hypothetical protein